MPTPAEYRVCLVYMGDAYSILKLIIYAAINALPQWVKYDQITDRSKKCSLLVSSRLKTPLYCRAASSLRPFLSAFQP